MSSPETSSPTEPGQKKVGVWDIVVRIFHWGLVVSFFTSWFVGETNYDVHLTFGYAALSLICIRLVWGFVARGHARFSDFIVGPFKTLSYIRARLNGKAPRYLGHNPAGAAMIVALLLTVITICISGVALDAAENFAGPLAGFRLYPYVNPISEVHEISTNLALVLVGLHIAGVVVESLSSRENLVAAMISGKKHAKSDQGKAVN